MQKDLARIEVLLWQVKRRAEPGLAAVRRGEEVHRRWELYEFW